MPRHPLDEWYVANIQNISDDEIKVFQKFLEEYDSESELGRSALFVSMALLQCIQIAAQLSDDALVTHRPDHGASCSAAIALLGLRHFGHINQITPSMVERVLLEPPGDGDNCKETISLIKVILDSQDLWPIYRDAVLLALEALALKILPESYEQCTTRAQAKRLATQLYGKLTVNQRILYRERTAPDPA
jgi:hypothetical protein